MFVIFLGGVVSRTSLEQGLPGQYEPTADPRSMTADVLAAASWLRENFGTGNRVIGDRTDLRSSAPTASRTRSRDRTAEYARGGSSSRVRSRRMCAMSSATTTSSTWSWTAGSPLSSRAPAGTTSRASRERETGSGRCRPQRLEKFDHSRLFERIYDNGNVVIYQYLPAGGQPTGP